MDKRRCRHCPVLAFKIPIAVYTDNNHCHTHPPPLLDESPRLERHLRVCMFVHIHRDAHTFHEQSVSLCCSSSAHTQADRERERERKVKRLIYLVNPRRWFYVHIRWRLTDQIVANEWRLLWWSFSIIASSSSSSFSSCSSSSRSRSSSLYNHHYHIKNTHTHKDCQSSLFLLTSVPLYTFSASRMSYS